MLAAVCMTMLLFVQPAKADVPVRQDKVLFISSYSLSYPSVSKQISGIKKGLDKDVYLYYEFMDGKTINDDKYVGKFYNYINYKYSHISGVSAVIVGDDDALQMVLRYRNGFFKNMPVVYESADSRTRIEIADALGMTGIPENNTIGANLDLARKLYPKARKIVAVTDDSKTGRVLGADLRAIKSRYSPMDVEIIDTSVLKRKEITDIIEKVSNDSILLFMSFINDADGRSYTYDEAQDLVVGHTKAPVFTLIWAGNGCIGGVSEDYEAIGRQAGKMADGIISGTSPEKIKTNIKDTTVTVFDCSVMERFGIQKTALPADTIYINDTERSTDILLIVLIFSVGLIALGGLLFKAKKENLRRRHNEKMLRMVSERFKAESEIDALTGLSNRRTFDKEIARIMQAERKFILYIFDIDNFKSTNDTFGHSVGDEVLRETGSRLRAVRKRSIAPYRYGGDEFTVIYFPESPEDTEEISKKIIDLLSVPIVTRAGDHEIRISLGSARFPDDAGSIDDLIGCADHALYYIKNHGGNGSIRYSDLT